MTIKTLSPVDGSVYCEKQTASDAAITNAVIKSRDAQQFWKKTSFEERSALCLAVVESMLGMRDDIVQELAWQMGRPIRYGAGELAGFEERARHMISIAEHSLADLDPGKKAGFVRKIVREPLGVVLTIAPWNFPYLTTVNSVIPAIMSGNSVILKHASQTLKVGDRFAEAFKHANAPEGLFQSLVMDHAQTEKLISTGSADMVCFTGSVPAGSIIEKAAAGQFISVGLELGGKDPAYVRHDCDLEHAIENIADGVFFNSGQSCCGIERIYVADSLHDQFVEGITGIANDFVLGNPLDEATTLGPMIKPAAADYVRKQIADAVAAGGIAHVDQSRFPLSEHGSAYMAPEIVSNVNHDMSLMKDESFGPVVGIMRVQDDQEAIRLMNDSEFGLTAAIWTQDVKAAQDLGSQLDTGTVFMNRCDYLDPALAWTGVKNTGRGCTLSSMGYESLTRPKSYHLRQI